MTPFEAGVSFLPLTLFTLIVPLATRDLVTRIPARLAADDWLGAHRRRVVADHGPPDSKWTTLLAGFMVSEFGDRVVECRR